MIILYGIYCYKTNATFLSISLFFQVLYRFFGRVTHSAGLNIVCFKGCKRINRVIEVYWMSVINVEAKIHKMYEGKPLKGPVLACFKST